MAPPFRVSRPWLLVGVVPLWLTFADLVPSAGGQEVPFLVKDIESSSGDGSPGGFTESGGSLFFSAVDGIEGPFGDESWKTDGTTGGTVLVKDIVPGPQGSGPQSLTDVSGTLFFTAISGSFRQVWKSDGTAGGTLLLGGGLDQELAAVGPSLFFTAFDGTSCYELWRSEDRRGNDAGQGHQSRLRV